MLTAASIVYWGGGLVVAVPLMVRLVRAKRHGMPHDRWYWAAVAVCVFVTAWPVAVGVALFRRSGRVMDTLWHAALAEADRPRFAAIFTIGGAVGVLAGLVFESLVLAAALGGIAGVAVAVQVLPRNPG